MSMLSKVFGTRSQREVKRIMPLVNKIESLRPDMQKLTDDELRGKTREFKKRLEEGATLDDILPEAFAALSTLVKCSGILAWVSKLSTTLYMEAYCGV